MSNVLPDNGGASVGGTALTTKTLTSFAIGAAASRLLLIGVSQWSATDRAPSGNFNTSETLVVHDAQTVAEGAGTRRATVLRLIAPSNVTASVIINYAGTVDEMVVGADSWSNVDQTTPLGTAVKTSGTGASSSVAVPNASGDVVHDVAASDCDASAGNTGNQTQRWKLIAASATTEGNGQSAAGAGSNITCTWTYVHGASTIYAHIGVAIKQATAAATIEQEGYRWRNDDGSEAAATWPYAQDNEMTAPADSARRLRVILNATNDPTAISPQLEYRKVGDTNWRKVK